MPTNPFEPSREGTATGRDGQRNDDIELAGLLISLGWIVAVLAGAAFLYFYIPWHK